MKFILFLLSFLYVNNVALAEEKVKADYVAKQVDKYKEECFNKYAFPKGIDNYSMYNDDIKEGDFRYHQCLKNIIIEKIKEILAEQLDADPEEMTMDTKIAEDLEADSLDVVELLMSIEDEFEVEIPDEEIENLKTIGDVVEYIQNNMP